MAQFDEFRSFVRRDVPLAMYSRLQLGGPAEYFAEPTCEAELIDLLRKSRAENIPIRVMGAGSNILVPEDGVSGVVLLLSDPSFSSVAVEDRRVTAGAGAKLGKVITLSVSRGLSGLEGLIGIPGTVGGALCENSETSNGDIGQYVDFMTVVDLAGEKYELSSSDLSFGYRTSGLDDVIILSATFRLEKDEPINLARRMQKQWIVCKSRQPFGESASAFAFKNPHSGTSAGDLIEQSGLKGARIGGAMISERNATFIHVAPEGTSVDVRRLTKWVCDEVETATGIQLQSAIKVW